MVIAIVNDLIDNKTNGSVITAIRFAEGLKAHGHEVRMVAIGADGPNDYNAKERYVPLVTEVSAKNQVKFGKFDREGIKKPMARPTRQPAGRVPHPLSRAM